MWSLDAWRMCTPHIECSRKVLHHVKICLLVLFTKKKEQGIRVLTSNAFQVTGCADSHLNVNEAVGNTVTWSVSGVISGDSILSKAAKQYENQLEHFQLPIRCGERQIFYWVQGGERKRIEKHQDLSEVCVRWIVLVNSNGRVFVLKSFSHFVLQLDARCTQKETTEIRYTKLLMFSICSTIRFANVNPSWANKTRWCSHNWCWCSCLLWVSVSLVFVCARVCICYFYFRVRSMRIYCEIIK